MSRSTYTCDDRTDWYPDMEPERREILFFWQDLMDILLQKWKQFREKKDYKNADIVRGWANNSGAEFCVYKDGRIEWMADYKERMKQ